MKNSIKRAQSQARLSFAERENFRPKVRQLKKTLLTLVALLAVTTGAWADETPLLTIVSTANTDFTSGSKTFDDKVTITFSNEVENDGDDDGWYNTGWSNMILSVTPAAGYTITKVKFYCGSGSAFDETSPFEATLYANKMYVNGSSIGSAGVNKIEVYGTAPGVATATPVDDFAWDEASKTGTFTMPGGNVTLEPEYYPQATVADGGVTAADADARATTDDPLVKVDATKLTGAKKLMYFVSNSGTTAPAYDAEGWTDQLPTAESITQQGIVYVWYYPVGTDEGVDGATATYSDGDICLKSITARIAAAPTYAVTFAEGINPEPPAEPEWTASPNTGVTKGQPVTVTYTGSKKVIGVKAEKKVAAAGIVNPEVGQVIGSDGNNYAANATLPDGVTKVAMIAYVSGSNGLALALTDEEGIYTWDNSAPYNNGKTAPEICSALNTSKAVTGGTWKLPSKDEWKQMFSANGGNDASYTGLNTALGNAGGTALVENDEYWSSSEFYDDAWLVNLSDGNASWDTYGKHYSRYVRACLAF